MVDNWYIRKQKAALFERDKNMSSTIRKGSTGEDVRHCQSLLVQHGISTDVDGVFGSGTERSVKSFQSSQGLTADGIVGPATWSALEEGVDPPEDISFSDVAELFPQMYPQTYTLHGAQCPSNPPGMSLKNIGNDTTNCVQFSAWLLSYAFEGVRFTKTQWSKWMVSGDLQGKPPVVPNWGPRVVLEWGRGTTEPGKGAYLIQSFTSGGGHSYLVIDHDEESGKILTLEATSALNLNGAGWAQIGNLRDVHNPGPDWKDKVTQTWESRIQRPNVAVHMVRLAIDPQSIQEWLENA